MDLDRRGRLLAASLMTLACAVGTARAETLADAVALAYQSNPTLQQTRSQLRALDETYVQARSILRPTVSVGGQLGYQNTDGPFGLEANSAGATLTAAQPLYTSGRGTAQVRAAENDIRAGRESLRQTEIDVLRSVVTSYLDVRRDGQVVGIRLANDEVLNNQLAEAQAKFEAGQITRTDVAQAEAQAAQARALLTSARAQLQISRAAYTAVVGQNPGELAPEPPLPGVPETVEQAFDVAQADSPLIRRAQADERASQQRVAVARALGRPTVSLGASFGYTGALSPFDVNDGRAFTTQATYSQPLFTGGLVRSQVRQALEQNTQRRVAIEGARRLAVQNVSQAWNVMTASRANTISTGQQVRAARLAFEGVQEEYRVGLRTTLDVLITQQQLRDAELQLVNARRDEYVAGANLLAAMGRLEARTITGGVPLYDAGANLERVRAEGATPWDGAVARLDRFAAARPGTAGEIPAPPPPAAPPSILSPEAAPARRSTAPAVASPTAPAPGTAAPSTPPTLGARTGPAPPPLR